MSPTLVMCDDVATADKAPIWGAGAPTPDETTASVDASAEAVLTEPRVYSPGPRQDEDAHADATEHLQEAICEDITPFVRLTTPGAPYRRFEVLQQWEGVVSKVTEDSVWADLVDLTDRSRSEEVVELPLAEISEADRSILEPGSVFYWAIGREWSPGGQMRRVSEIRVRRTPQWTQRSVDALKAKALTLMERFNGNSEDSTEGQ